jgi:hypothetical protein
VALRRPVSTSPHESTLVTLVPLAAADRAPDAAEQKQHGADDEQHQPDGREQPDAEEVPEQEKDESDDDHGFSLDVLDRNLVANSRSVMDDHCVVLPSNLLVGICL